MSHFIPRSRQATLLASVLFLALFQWQCAQPTPQEQARALLEEAAQAMGGLQALEGIDNITRTGTSLRNSYGQGHTKEDRFLRGRAGQYSQTIDFTGPREFSLTGPREVLSNADDKKGGYRNVFGMAYRPMLPEQMHRYRTEWTRDIAKFLVHALGPESTIQGMEEQPDGPVVNLQFVDGLDYEVHLDPETHLISKLVYTDHINPFGDIVHERVFEDYRDVSGVQLPFKETTHILNDTLQQREWSEITVNGEVPEERFEIPEPLQELARNFAQSEKLPLVATELADGVYFGEGVAMNTLWVEFEDFVLVVEGPEGETQSEATIEKIRETVGDKPIRYLVTTHPHPDHTGGIRTFAAEGATIVTHANNEDQIRKILTGPHTVSPDRLAESGAEAQIELVEETYTITDGKRRVELMHVPNSHSDGYLAIYLPRERILFESDMFQIQGDRFQVVLNDKPSVPPEGIELYDAVTQAKWRVNQLAPGHGRLLTWKLLADTVKAAR